MKVLEGPEGPWKPWEIFGMTLKALDQQKRYSRGAQNDLLKKGDIVTLGGGGQPQYLFLAQIYQVSKNIGNWLYFNINLILFTRFYLLSPKGFPKA